MLKRSSLIQVSSMYALLVPSGGSIRRISTCLYFNLFLIKYNMCSLTLLRVGRGETSMVVHITGKISEKKLIRSRGCGTGRHGNKLARVVTLHVPDIECDKMLNYDRVQKDLYCLLSFATTLNLQASTPGYHNKRRDVSQSGVLQSTSTQRHPKCRFPLTSQTPVLYPPV